MLGGYSLYLYTHSFSIKYTYVLITFYYRIKYKTSVSINHYNYVYYNLWNKVYFPQHVSFVQLKLQLLHVPVVSLEVFYRCVITLGQTLFA